MDSLYLDDLAQGRRGHPRRRATHYRIAVALAVVGMVALLFLVPEAWVRWLFHRDFGPPPAAFTLEPAEDFTGPIRLIPVELLPPPRAQSPAAPTRPIAARELLVSRPAEPSPEEASGSENSVWTWDPTSTYSIAGELTGPAWSAVAPRDSVRLRGDLLRALRLGDLDPALAMLDTTQSALAREQFHAVDRWFHRNWARIWEAQGAAARLADIYERAVLEAERDKGM